MTTISIDRTSSGKVSMQQVLKELKQANVRARDLNVLLDKIIPRDNLKASASSRIFLSKTTENHVSRDIVQVRNFEVM